MALISRLGQSFGQALAQYDLALFHKVFKQGRRRIAITAAKVISKSGDGYLHALIPLALALTGAPQWREFGQLLALSLLLERALYWLLKNTLRRSRPYDAMPGLCAIVKASDQFSFPSGHSSAACLLVVCLSLVYGAGFVVLGVWAGAVALSRVVLGVHYPGDTLAGATIGGGIAYLVSYWQGVL